MYFQGNIKRHSDLEKQIFNEYEEYFNESPLPTINKLQCFPKYVRRQDLARFLAKNEIFKLQLDVPGIIVECGVYMGGGVMTFAQLSAIYEPYNHTRKIVGFDTFEGFSRLSGSKDDNREKQYSDGDLSTYDGIQKEITKAIELSDKNRPLSHISKIELIKGDAVISIPEYLQNNPHTIISMLYLDFDIYEPTKIALENLMPRIPKGGVVAFDELNCINFPGETLAVMEVLSISKLKLRKTNFDPWISYAVIE